MRDTVVKGLKIAAKVSKAGAKASIKKLPESERTNVVEKMFPYRTTGVGNLAIIAGVTTIGAAKMSVDLNKHSKARKLGEFRAHALANQIGQSPIRYSEEFLQGLPERKRQTITANKLRGPEDGEYLQGFDDLGAGGDLVFALNNLR